ncbi:XisI protein [Roseofilum capinflatum]|uniref:XisI protein n=1 Tax=Roseofilum capinflatum BLCC-M114 TaxID=3022440 RepID=A0ABT7BAX4_9CYAN|nr:XisI protein [Roseofilum capinflatum]MDJ1175972.1 XisI protein [Roseofilum capinflatum BLCC-M114]
MDKIGHYRDCIQKLLTEHSHYSQDTAEVESLLCFDVERDRYQLMRVGWKHLKRIYYTVLHFDIRDGQIWLQQNATDSDVGEELVAMGVPREDIVLGLQPPYKRPYTGYGVGGDLALHCNE